MKRFAELYDALDMTNSTNAKVAAMVEYFGDVDAASAAWAIYFLTGQKLKRLISSKKLRQWAGEYAGHPDWLVEECYTTVGDSAEVVALMVDDGRRTSPTDLLLCTWVEDRLLSLREMDDDAEKREAIIGWWQQLHGSQLFMLNKLMSSAFRVGVSRRLVTRALAEFTGIDQASLAHRLMGSWDPSPEFYEMLIDPDTEDADRSRPYPFFLASQLEQPPRDLGPITDWQAEWKWDGIRGQLIRRAGHTYLWSRGEELVTKRYPEIEEVSNHLPDGVVLDGEILTWDLIKGRPGPFSKLQRRIGRKRISKKLMRKIPVRFVAYDLMEHEGEDIREHPLEQRRARLEEVVSAIEEGPLLLSDILDASTWDELAALRAESRDRKVEGLMLKQLGSPYRVGRKRGDWWKWKVDPFTLDTVLIYAQAGSGRRARLHTDYTLAVWDDDDLVPIAKAYSGLTDDQLKKMDRWIRDHTEERFGPVRSVTAHHVFEIAFEGLAPSNRHKSGIALRFPRIKRWRQDKPKEEANTLADAEALLDAYHD